MKKIKKLSIILGVLLLGVIIMSSNADAKKKSKRSIVGTLIAPHIFETMTLL